MRFTLTSTNMGGAVAVAWLMVKFLQYFQSNPRRPAEQDFALDRAGIGFFETTANGTAPGPLVIAKGRFNVVTIPVFGDIEKFGCCVG